MDNFWELKKIKEQRKDPKVGDIFVIQPIDNVYFFGKVIMSNIQSTNAFVNSMWLINIYNKSVKSESIPNKCNMELNDLLIPPQIVNKKGWTLGYFYTIGNSPVIDDRIDYGFEVFSLKQYMSEVEQPKKFVDVHGNRLSHEPKYHCIWGLSSYAVVGELVQKAIKENPQLIESTN